jgi:O-antigen ligase/Flp pilus assembly protein TadD
MTQGDQEQQVTSEPIPARARSSRRRSSGSGRWSSSRAAELRGDFIDSGTRRLTRMQWISRGAETLLVAMIAFAALAFGGIEAWAQFVVAIGAVALTALTAIRCVVMRQPFVWSWLYVPVALFVMLCLAQAWQGVPAALVGAISPEAASLWKSVGASSTAMSVYPQATIDQLRIIVVAGAVLVCVANLIRTRWQAVRLLAGITIVGLVVGCLAALQDLTLSPLIYWIGPPGRGLANAGPFVHYSHYGQFINVCMFAGLAWALVTLVRVQREFDLSPRDLLRAMRDVRGRPVWLAATLLLVGTCTLLYSTSRTATISFGVGLTLAILLTSRARLLHGRAWWVTPPLVLVFGAASVLGLQVAVERLREMNSFEPYEQRKQIIADSVELWQRFPIVGTGLGTFEYVYPMVDRGTVNEVTTHAENEYVQLMTETGAVGVALAGAFLMGAGWLLVRQLRTMRSSVHMATIGVAAALVATAIHAFSDFALHMPANAVLVATLLGLLIALGRIDRQDGAATDHVETSEEPADRPVPRFAWAEMVRERGPWIAWTMLLVVTSVLLLPSSGRAWRAESLARSAYDGMLETEKMGWSGTDVQYARILKSMEDARAAQPGSAVYAYRHHLFIYWAILRERGMSSSAVELSQVEVSYLTRLADELRRARQLAPTYAPPVALLERVLRGLGRTEEAEALMDERHKLNRADGEASLVVARRAASSGDWAAAQQLYARAVERHADFGEVARDLVLKYDRPQIARDIAGKSLAPMAVLRDVLRQAGKTDLAERIELDRIDVMREAALDPAAEPELLADLAAAIADRGETGLAIDYYRRALVRDYNNLTWRVQLITILLNRNTPDSITSAIDELDRATRIVDSNDDPRLSYVRERIRKLRAASTQPAEHLSSSRSSLFELPLTRDRSAGHVWQGVAFA